MKAGTGDVTAEEQPSLTSEGENLESWLGVAGTSRPSRLAAVGMGVASGTKTGM